MMDHAEKHQTRATSELVAATAPATEAVPAPASEATRVPETAPATDGRGTPRPVDLVLARAHLRLGSLALARAELEILAGRGALDTQGHVDLAEARWRTGDLHGAGVAAAIAMGAGEDQPVVLAIAAEAAAALGRPNEARRLAGKAMLGVSGPIDNLFAGMPRSGVWPTDAAEPPATTGTLFHHEPAPSPYGRAGDANANAAALRAGPPEELVDRRSATLTLGFWDPDGADDMFAHAQPDPASELEAARAALVAGALEDATLRFGLALRLAPALAPAVLEATDGIATPAINVVRGDAFRLVGLEIEASRAYAAAAWSGARDRRHKAERETAVISARTEAAASAEAAASPEAASPEAIEGRPTPDA
jgi:hypothetical protein